MILYINGSRTQAKRCTTLHAARERYAPDSDVMIMDGFQTEEDLELQENAQLTFLKKGELPGREELRHMLFARHTPGVQQKLQSAAVGVAGLGGLGSRIAELLCRCGVGRLVLADFDTVEPTNLNRQNYRICHLGRPKAGAMREQLAEINPYVEIEAHAVKITEQNAAALFTGCTVVCEAFDGPEDKAMLVNALLTQTDITVVSSSGMAGLRSANAIRTVRRMSRLFVCGDGEAEARPGKGLMAPRVSVCASHQANMALRLLTGTMEP